MERKQLTTYPRDLVEYACEIESIVLCAFNLLSYHSIATDVFGHDPQLGKHFAEKWLACNNNFMTFWGYLDTSNRMILAKWMRQRISERGYDTVRELGLHPEQVVDVTKEGNDSPSM